MLSRGPVVSSIDAIKAFVNHLWVNEGLEVSAASTRFFREHNLVAGDKETIPHYCPVCGVCNTVELPRV